MKYKDPNSQIVEDIQISTNEGEAGEEE